MRFETLERRFILSTAGYALPVRTGMPRAITPSTPDANASATSITIASDKNGSLQNRNVAQSAGDSKVPLQTVETRDPALSVGTITLALTAEAIPTGGIHLQWEPLNLSPDGQIIVLRKSPEETDWTAPAIAEPPINATSYDDLTAETGVAYEYKIIAYSELGGAPTEKYILAGNSVAPVHNRGTILLVIDSTQLDSTRDASHTSLLPALNQYQADLIAEGYKIRTITTPRVDIPRGIPADPTDPTQIEAMFGPWKSAVANVKNQIRTIWQQTPDLESIFLIGHVPVPYSGLENPDGEAHAASHGAWAADVYYGSLSTPDSAWLDETDSELGTGVNRNLPGDGKFDLDVLSLIGEGTELENNAFTDVPVGRIDFAGLYPFKGISQTPDPAATVAETNLLARYLQKDHEWKTGQWDVNHQALFEEAFPFPEYYDTNRLTPNVGMDQIVRGSSGPLLNVPGADPQNYDLHNQSWMWMYVGAAGFPDHSTLQFNPNRQLHTDQYVNGDYATPGTLAAATDEGNHKSVFNFIYGSYVGDWDQPRSLLRAVIAEPDGLGLASMWGARPNWNQHRMGLGFTIGDTELRTINNFGEREAYEYQPFESSTRLALMGDPTLRQENVVPATGVNTAANPSGPGTVISWTASTDAGVAGYYVYRASSPEGPFTLLDSSMALGTTYTDTTSSGGESYYMVRAAKLQTSPSGTYWNLSLGTIAAPRVTATQFLRTSKPQILEVTFDQDVSSSITSGDFVISGQRRNFQTGANQPVTFVAGTDFHLVSYDVLTRTARIQFDLSNEANVAGVVPSGRYTLGIAPNALTNAFSIPVASTYSFAFGYLSGDTNGDLKVDFSDLVTVAQHYNKPSTGGPLAGDFNNDGIVNFDDLVTLAQHYGKSV